MEKWLKQLLTKLNTQQTELAGTMKALDDDALTDEAREGLLAAAEEQTAAIEKTNADVTKTQKAIETSNAAQKSFAGAAGASIAIPGSNAGQSATETLKSLARSSAISSVKNFKGDDGDVRAYKFAQWFFATQLGNEKAAKFCQDHNILMGKTQVEGQNELGGYMVPPEFSTDIIDLREKYGVFERNAKREPMARETKTVWVNDEELEAFFTAEMEKLQETEKGYSAIELTAKKIGAIALLSNELNDDAMVNIGDDLAMDLAKASAKKKDLCGFLGDGSKSYGKILGIIPALKGMDATVANVGGLVEASGNLWSEITLGDILNLMGAIPERAEDDTELKFYCSRKFFVTVLARIAMAAGGASAAEFVAGIATKQKVFMGHQVETSVVLPRKEANSQIPLLFGNLRAASRYGDRKQMILTRSTEYKWAEDALAIKMIERFDIVNHDLGTASADEDERKAGSVVGLITQAA